MRGGVIGVLGGRSGARDRSGGPFSGANNNNNKPGDDNGVNSLVNDFDAMTNNDGVSSKANGEVSQGFGSNGRTGFEWNIPANSRFHITGGRPKVDDCEKDSFGDSSSRNACDSGFQSKDESSNGGSRSVSNRRGAFQGGNDFVGNKFGGGEPSRSSRGGRGAFHGDKFGGGDHHAAKLFGDNFSNNGENANGGLRPFASGRGAFQGRGDFGNNRPIADDLRTSRFGRGAFQGGSNFGGNKFGDGESSRSSRGGCGAFQGGGVVNDKFGGSDSHDRSRPFGNGLQNKDDGPNGGSRPFSNANGRGAFQGRGDFGSNRPIADGSRTSRFGRGAFQGGNGFGEPRPSLRAGRTESLSGGNSQPFGANPFNRDANNNGVSGQRFGGGRGGFSMNNNAIGRLFLSSRGGKENSENRFGHTTGMGEGVFNRRTHNDFGDETRSGRVEPPEHYVPPIRSVEELFKEDSEHAENYRMIVDDDEDITTSGHNVRHSVAIDTWEDAKFEPQLLTNIIQRSMYVRPRKIQASSIPLILEGRDVKGHAETGSGKTAAFMLPLINMLMKSERIRQPLSGPSPFAIVIEPTRELCAQVYEQGRKFANDTGIFVAKAYGQFDQASNLRELQGGCDILCATPGRLMHFVSSRAINLERLKYLVFDEADRLLEYNFLSALRNILSFPGFPKREERQTLLFSATYSREIQDLAEDVLKPDNVMISNKKLVAPSAKVAQSFISVQGSEKKQALFEMLEKLLKRVKEENRVERVLVFVKTRREADLLSLWLSQQEIKSTTINGDRSQVQRETALRHFRTGDMCVLVATDVCARGIDIKDLDHVVNYDLPDDHVMYVHRIGRTGRVKGGFATSFFDETSDNDLAIAKYLVEFLKDAKQEVPEFLNNVVNNMSGMRKQSSSQPRFGTFGAPLGANNGASSTTAAEPVGDPTNAVANKHDDDDDPWAADD